MFRGSGTSPYDETAEDEGGVGSRLNPVSWIIAAVSLLMVGLVVTLIVDERSNDPSDPEQAGSSLVPSSALGPTTETNPSTSDTSSPAIVGPYVQASLNAGEFTLAGVVPSATLAGDLLQAAEVTYSPRVRSELVVDEQLEEVGWLAGAPDAIVLLPIITSASIVIADGRVELAGESPDQASVDRLEAALSQVTRLPITVGDVEVTGLRPPTYVMAATDGQVTLTGDVPSEDIRAMLVDGAVAAYGEGRVQDRVTVDPGVYPALWMYNGEPLMRAMSTFPEYELRIDGIAFSGFINGGVTFELNSAEFSGSYAEVLDVGVGVLTRDQSLQLTIEGHTDNIGPAEVNLALSQLRAEAVRDYFISNGIDPDRLIAVGMGEEDPIVPNDSEEGRARNRRIEYVLSTAG